MSDGKVVVRVQLGSKAASSNQAVADVPEYQWLWHRILGAAVLVLLPFWWLWPEPAESPQPPLTAVVSASGPSIHHDMTPQAMSTAGTEDSVQVANPEPVIAAEAVAVAPPPAVKKLAPAPAFQAAPAVAPLFISQSGTLRKVVLTMDKPGPAAQQLVLPLQLDRPTELALYTEVVGLAGQQIEHRWFYKDKLMTRVELPVKLPYWRTWSQKRFYPAELADWRVEILGPQQKLLFSYSLNER
ncbi:DUF2914 domain-containing protein [Rheinheimera marina]|uniref:DUF2914 domain-containing protein n=1 Tax=Rheinheimera marina TaxID=1774958 RepID=A0ABV9JRX0_9GAMM